MLAVSTEILAADLFTGAAHVAIIAGWPIAVGRNWHWIFLGGDLAVRVMLCHWASTILFSV